MVDPVLRLARRRGTTEAQIRADMENVTPATPESMGGPLSWRVPEGTEEGYQSQLSIAKAQEIFNKQGISYWRNNATATAKAPLTLKTEVKQTAETIIKEKANNISLPQTTIYPVFGNGAAPVTRTAVSQQKTPTATLPTSGSGGFTEKETKKTNFLVNLLKTKTPTVNILGHQIGGRAIYPEFEKTDWKPIPKMDIYFGSPYSPGKEGKSGKIGEFGGRSSKELVNVPFLGTAEGATEYVGLVAAGGAVGGGLKLAGASKAGQTVMASPLGRGAVDLGGKAIGTYFIGSAAYDVKKSYGEGGGKAAIRSALGLGMSFAAFSSGMGLTWKLNPNPKIDVLPETQPKPIPSNPNVKKSPFFLEPTPNLDIRGEMPVSELKIDSAIKFDPSVINIKQPSMKPIEYTNAEKTPVPGSLARIKALMAPKKPSLGVSIHGEGAGVSLKQPRKTVESSLFSFKLTNLGQKEAATKITALEYRGLRVVKPQNVKTQEINTKTGQVLIQKIKPKQDLGVKIHGEGAGVSLMKPKPMTKEESRILYGVLQKPKTAKIQNQAAYLKSIQKKAALPLIGVYSASEQDINAQKAFNIQSSKDRQIQKQTRDLFSRNISQAKNTLPDFKDYSKAADNKIPNPIIPTIQDQKIPDIKIPKVIIPDKKKDKAFKIPGFDEGGFYRGVGYTRDLLPYKKFNPIMTAKQVNKLLRGK